MIYIVLKTVNSWKYHKVFISIVLIELWWFSMSPPCLSFTCSNCVWRKHNSQGYPGYYRGPHWKSMGLTEVSRLDLTILENIQSIFSVSIISQHWLLQEVHILPDANKIPNILARYVKLRVVQALGMPGTFSRHCGLAIPTCIVRDARAVMHAWNAN